MTMTESVSGYDVGVSGEVGSIRKEIERIEKNIETLSSILDALFGKLEPVRLNRSTAKTSEEIPQKPRSEFLNRLASANYGLHILYLRLDDLTSSLEL